MRAGFIRYGVDSLVNLLGLEEVLASRVEADLADLLDENSGTDFSRSVMAFGSDRYALGQYLCERYGMALKEALPTIQHVGSVSLAITRQADHARLGIEWAEWLVGACGRSRRTAHNASHLAAAGQRYRTSEGLLLDGRTVLPGAAIGCTCMGAPEISFG
jgi:hypothetical protein